MCTHAVPHSVHRCDSCAIRKMSATHTLFSFHVDHLCCHIPFSFPSKNINTIDFLSSIVVLELSHSYYFMRVCCVYRVSGLTLIAHAFNLPHTTHLYFVMRPQSSDNRHVPLPTGTGSMVGTQFYLHSAHTHTLFI